MPDAVEDPQFHSQGSTELGKGDSLRLEEGFGVAASAPFTLQPFQPADTSEEFLFSSTDFPQRPITHGAPFGPGDNVLALPREDEDTFMARFAAQVMETKSPEENKIWAARLLAGE